MEQRTPWSWLAFAVSAIFAGLVQLLCLFGIVLLREGTGTDLSLSMSEPSYWLAGAAQTILLSMGMIALARWFGNRNGYPRRRFLIVVTGLPIVLLFGLALVAIASIGVQGLSLFDPRRWLEVPVFGLVFYAAGRVYLAVADAGIAARNRI